MSARLLHRRSASILGTVLLVTAVLGGWRATRSGAEPTTSFGSWTLTATAPGFEATEDEPSANAHPEGGGTVPYATAALDGGSGYGLSSVAWPGATEANADKLVLLLFPKSIDQGPVHQPVPDAVTQLVGTAAPLSAYPVRAEASTGTSPDATLDATAATLKAHADPSLAQATAVTAGANGQAGFTIGQASTSASATLTADKGEATAHSHVADIDIGGVIKIKSVESTATASTDAASGASEGQTVVSGMSIAGQPAYVDDTGLHLGDQSQPLNAVATQIANQALSQGGFDIRVSMPEQVADGATASYTAGSLFIVWKPPSNPSENVFVITLGGARASVTAAPAFDTGSTDDGAGPPPTSGSGASTSRPAATGTGTTRRPGITPNPATTKSPAPTSAGGVPVEPLGAVPIAQTFTGLGGWVVVGLVGAALLAAGTRRIADEIVDRPPSTCPLEM